MTTPSVTTVLGLFADFSMVRPDILKAACERGTAVHGAIHIHISGGFACPDPDHRGYFDSACRWIDAHVKRVVLAEHRMRCEAYHGKPDLIAELNDGTIALIDWKTALAAGKTWPVQTAAYRNLYELYRIGKMSDLPFCGRNIGIRPKKDGKLAIVNDHSATYDRDMNLWWSALNWYNYLKG